MREGVGGREDEKIEGLDDRRAVARQGTNVCQDMVGLRYRMAMCLHERTRKLKILDGENNICIYFHN